MPDSPLPTYTSIDWLQLWRNARRQQQRKSRTAADWDRKAPGFASRNQHSPFIDLLLARLPVSRETTVLDVGCGPGNLALPIARLAKAVSALDFSPRMLEILKGEIQRQELTNIRPYQCAWEDDWTKAGIGMHDIAIASRSLSVEDLPAAIAKLDSHASRAVFIADRIAPTPYAPEAYAAIGRPFSPGPDYIYTLNILYTMGIYPHVEILELPAETTYPSLSEAAATYAWMLKDLSEQEETLLKAFLAKEAHPQEDGSIMIRRHQPLRWALIWWSKDSLPTGNNHPKQKDT